MKSSSIPIEMGLFMLQVDQCALVNFARAYVTCVDILGPNAAGI
jgi:hypothetical protein